MSGSGGVHINISQFGLRNLYPGGWLNAYVRISLAGMHTYVGIPLLDL